MKSFKELNEMPDKRYVVTIEMYMWDKDDATVIKQADKLVKTLRRQDDNEADVVEIVAQDPGKIGNRKVK